ncbi:uncharacterized protein LOC131668560 [Phymastichus coffea]|uniref:uncharacterized protein LOC131668560 n=1 Tax=Phymastichus coffea TaxID=108790 RepID=UPI00273C0CB9|nr:uncharacterized protein LOC131668560 [Phymastichus coffea]
MKKEMEKKRAEALVRRRKIEEEKKMREEEDKKEIERKESEKRERKRRDMERRREDEKGWENRKEEEREGEERMEMGEASQVFGKRKIMDRNMGGNKDIYIVCEDLRNGPKIIKKDIGDRELSRTREGKREEEGSVDRKSERVKEAERRKIEAEEEEAREDALTKMRSITRDLMSILLTDANKVTNWVVDRVMGQCVKYEELIQGLIVEKAKVEGEMRGYEKSGRELVEMVGHAWGGVKEALEGVERRGTGAARRGEVVEE